MGETVVTSADIVSGISVAENGETAQVIIPSATQLFAEDNDGNLLPVTVEEGEEISIELTYVLDSAGDLAQDNVIELSSILAVSSATGFEVLGGAAIEIFVGDQEISNFGDTSIQATISLPDSVVAGDIISVLLSNIDGVESLGPQEAPAGGEIIINIPHLTTAAIVGGIIVAGAVVIDDGSEDDGTGGFGSSS